MSHLVQAYARGLAKPLDELLDTSALLRDDIQRLLVIFDDDWGDPLFRRTLVRACWAYIEAVVFGLKQIVLIACTLGSEELSPKTRNFLAEQVILIDSGGNAVVQPVRSDVLKSIKLTLKLASSHFDVAWKPNFGGGEWPRLQRSLALRHRLTHPKGTEDLTVSLSEIEDHRDAFLWFSRGFNDFLQSMQRRYEA